MGSTTLGGGGGGAACPPPHTHAHLRLMYPVSAVLTAVSTSPSRPPMVWKKNSVGVRPL
jgi:hypothetical protein